MRLLGMALIAFPLLGTGIASALPLPTLTADITRSSPLLQVHGKKCRREPIWGFRISAFCKPTGASAPIV